ncbi:non-lysosomal glucosylceramidase [Actinoplanes sp. TRM 88003]|uniref:Non-lysosomal glucosylceramidase n=1 Tax=Paractinoplanes aksuensis TaxID=2939490 RepID=A0ABT1DLJ2_9ACTN|nr:GH116 family glycosyl hydrolase [Actinoplanes aksuensis]MCO8271707.1 non-lysosomal glucosylceramidase [Actinoplanes aksuensis]
MRFTGDARRAVAFPLGGLGTGHVALCGDGALRQWQLLGVPNHDALLPDSFFALRVSSLEPPADVVRLLQSEPPAYTPAPNVSDGVYAAPDRRWPLVEDTMFEAAYPFATVDYHDSALPVAVTLEAHTPFVPLDVDASSLPLVTYRFTIRNDSTEFRHGFLLAALQNATGWDGVTPIDGTRGAGYGGNVNRVLRRPGQSGVLMDHPGLAEDDPSAGEMLLWTDAPAAVLPRAHDADTLLRWVETLRLATPTQLGDFSPAALRAALRDGASPMRAPVGPSPAGHTWDAGVAAAFALPPGESTTIDIVHAWWFPNRYADFDRFGPQPTYGPTRFWVGNHYATRFGGALDVLDAYLADREELDANSRAWADAVATSDLPQPLLDTIATQPSLVRSPSIFRTADGRTFAFEGALGASTRNWNGDAGGSCPLNCNHVLNYEQALSRLFPAIGRDMRETEFLVQSADGSIPHRVVLPLYLPQLTGVAIGGPARPALDGMLGAVLKTYRSVLDGAGNDWLCEQWPSLSSLMAYISGEWDRAGDGVLRGEQPVTYDIALHGPNMFVGALWLAALRAMSAMATLLAEPDPFSAVFEKAAPAYDELLWNGEFYAQPNTGEAYDFGPGCLSDQLLGQWWAHELGLGHLLPASRVRQALLSIVRYNLRTGFEPHGYRSFADGDETGLVVCSWPHGGRPAVPLRYCDEVWTGVEYQVAAHCFYEGLDDEGLAIVRGVRARYDGTRRNPFNEIECGDHYVRAMAGWSLLTAWTARDRPGRFPHVSGTSWGTTGLS